ncbi:substrate-binding domain-containing protein [Deinococcus planocerae]|uniref:substrate-binding domain-containing protein n=1 Tax=Deinococcus planocerae TaxID=1737569 RepID=UPI0015E14256|nr:substrate-binding domain-containing protein [Deinococcus planocerae]
MPHVRAWRERAGVGAGELARRAGLTRQALHRVETGAVEPGIHTALALARALGTTVEALFELAPQEVWAQPVGGVPAPGSRVRLARVGEHTLALPLGAEDSFTCPADGVTGPPRADGAVSVTPTGEALAARTLVVAGCDPSLRLLAAAVPGAAGRVLVRPLPSEEALGAVERGEAHVAAVHLWDPRAGGLNHAALEGGLGPLGFSVYRLWTWTQGWMVAPGNPRGIRLAANLAGPGVRLVNRPPGAGSRVLLDAWLEAEGLSPADVGGYDRMAASPVEVARMVRAGEADVGVGPQAVALAHGLDFVPVQVEPVELVVPAAHARHPALPALLAAAASPALHAQLATLGGYDPAGAGGVTRVRPARRSA